jgi:hypothetical protein
MKAFRTMLQRAVIPAVAGLVAATVAAGAHAATTDSIKVKVGRTVVVNFSTGDETKQAFTKLQVAAFPDGFKPGTLYLIEPKTEKDSILTSLEGKDVSDLRISDAISLNGSATTGKFNVFFISDGATKAQRDAFPIFATVNKIDEKGGPLDVSSYFGFPKGSIIVSSDVPEPGTWALMIAGMAGLGAVLRLRRSREAAPIC